MNVLGDRYLKDLHSLIGSLLPEALVKQKKGEKCLRKFCSQFVFKDAELDALVKQVQQLPHVRLQGQPDGILSFVKDRVSFIEK